MQRKYWLLIFIFPGISLTLHNCDESENTNETSGTVVDQVTKLPVEGATVYLGSLYMGESKHEITYSGYKATSRQDGTFRILIPDSTFNDKEREPRIYAGKNGYAGSSILVPLNGGSLDKNIELYHEATLNLRVFNDTINNQIDEIEIGLCGDIQLGSYPGFIGRMGGMMSSYPTITEKCFGRNYDTVFVYYPLWGNLDYGLWLRTAGGAWVRKYFVTLVPDSTTQFTIAF